jgi:hypothetical protein
MEANRDVAAVGGGVLAPQGERTSGHAGGAEEPKRLSPEEAPVGETLAECIKADRIHQ